MSRLGAEWKQIGSRVGADWKQIRSRVGQNRSRLGADAELIGSIGSIGS